MMNIVIAYSLLNTPAFASSFSGIYTMLSRFKFFSKAPLLNSFSFYFVVAVPVGLAREYALKFYLFC